MKKKRSDYVWVKLQISREYADFAESRWRKLRYFGRDDYLNALLNSAVMRDMDDEEERKNRPPKPPDDPDDPDNWPDDPNRGEPVELSEDEKANITEMLSRQPRGKIDDDIPF